MSSNKLSQLWFITVLWNCYSRVPLSSELILMLGAIESAQWHQKLFEALVHLSQLSRLPAIWHICLFIFFLYLLYLLQKTFLLTRSQPSAYKFPASSQARTHTYQLWDHISNGILHSSSCSKHPFRIIISSCIRFHKLFTMCPFIHSENNLDHVYKCFHIPDNPLKTSHL